MIFTGDKWRPRLRDRREHILALDSEDDSRGTVTLIVLTDGVTDRIFKTPEDAREFLSNYNLGSARLWAHNLEYDLCNVYRGVYGLLNWRFYGSRLIDARLYGTNTKFGDSTNIFGRVRLADVGKMIGKKKLAFDPRDEDYCVRDARIVQGAISQVREYLRALGGDLRNTIAASALYLWGARYAELPLPVLTPGVRGFFRRAYYGGRVEVFRYGKVRGDLSYLDVNSLFPSCMTGEYPGLWSLRLGGRHGIVKARVTVPEMEYPPLPYRTPDGLILYPVGTWSGVWCSNELDYARSVGVKVRVLDSVGSDSLVTPFRGYVQELYGRRKKSRNKTERGFLKLMLNSLYGKFGTAGGTAREIRSLDKLTGKSYAPLDSTSGMMNVRTPSPPYANVLWAAWTTAAARVVLHKALLRARNAGAEVLYCDTDSVIFDGPNPFPVSRDLGAWKVEKRCSEFEARGPKHYYFKASGRKRGEYRVKGVPRGKAGELFRKKVVRFERPYRLRESIRLGDCGLVNVWRETKKEDRKPTPRRCVLKGGRTRAPKV